MAPNARCRLSTRAIGRNSEQRVIAEDPFIETTGDLGKRDWTIKIHIGVAVEQKAQKDVLQRQKD